MRGWALRLGLPAQVFMICILASAFPCLGGSGNPLPSACKHHPPQPLVSFRNLQRPGLDGN